MVFSIFNWYLNLRDDGESNQKFSNWKTIIILLSLPAQNIVWVQSVCLCAKQEGSVKQTDVM